MKSSVAAVPTALLIAGLCLTADAAQAQSLGGMLGRLAERATERVGGQLPGGDRSRDSGSSASPAPSRRGGQAEAPGRATGEPGPAGVEPWPTNAGMRGVDRPTQFEFSDEMEAVKQAYSQASWYRCTGCEASTDIDHWRRAFGHPHETFGSWSRIMETWTPGRTIDWRGNHHDGQIIVLSEIPVGGFTCRQLRYRLTTREPRPTTIERPGLICLGKREYSSVETWHEVF